MLCEIDLRHRAVRHVQNEENLVMVFGIQLSAKGEDFLGYKNSLDHQLLKMFLWCRRRSTSPSDQRNDFEKRLLWGRRDLEKMSSKIVNIQLMIKEICR